MRRYEFFLLLALLLAFANTSGAEYWFQTGARGSPSSSGNTGASVMIQTIAPQNVSLGSMAFWVGENLPNGAFLQAGYVIENQTGYYPTNCTLLVCTSKTYLTAGKATWFFEYFLPGNNNTFLGSLGPDGSAGINGTYNTYGFRSYGNTWYFLFNNQTVGSADLGTSSSGIDWPVAIGELANTSTAKIRMLPVSFSNLSIYKSDKLLPIPNGYGTIGYGVGSKTNLKNPYGVQEISNRVDYFQVGSGIPQTTNNSLLWTLGYRLNIISNYANLGSRNVYTAYSTAQLSAPSLIYINATARALFLGWSGSGLGSYTGKLDNTAVTMNGNITETANWQPQYYVNVSSSFGRTTGTGWYNSTATAYYSLNTSTIYLNGTPRFAFAQWNNGNYRLNGTVLVNAPQQITAQWGYRVALLAKNAYGRQINVSYFLINGYQTNGTAYVTFNGTHMLQSAYYKGVSLPINISITQNTPASLAVQLPVYNVSIKTSSVLGQPVNAMAIVQFKNGTQIVTYSGQSGFVNFTNVPFGYSSAVLQYLGAKSAAVTGFGNTVRVVFLSSTDIAVFGSIALLILLFVVMRFRRTRVRAQGKV